MSTPTFQIVVCGSIVPDPLQTLEPVIGPAGPSLKNEMMLPAVLDPWAGHALFEAAHLARQMAGQQGLAGQPGAQGQAAAGDDDRGAEGALRAGGAGWAGLRLHRLLRDGGGAGRRHRGDRRARPRAAAAVRRVGIGLARRRLHLADGGRAAGNHGAVPGRGPDHGAGGRQLRSPGAHRRRTAPGVGMRRRRRRCWGGPPATCRSRATIRRWAWSTCATIMPALQRAKAGGDGQHRAALRFGEPAQTAAGRRAS